ncbi:MAG: hydantoinase/oxoprolinase family protein, partial [Chloroflexi bacterium]|nr:hydantoinase/oxoprolinase family protein [Chloroflexota bacterium]
AMGQKVDLSLPEIGPGKVGPPLKTQSVYFKEKGGFVDCPVYWREDLNAGNRLAGPVLIGEVDATVLVPPDCEAELDRYGNIIIELGG